MKNYTFHWELKDLIIQFIGALDESIVKRYDENKDVEKEVSVRYVYAPKSRVIHWLVNKQQHITLPVASVAITGITRDQSRVFNKVDGPTFMDSEVTSPLQPVPVDINISLSLLSKYQNDMDQMVTNFVPYFDPYIILSWKHPNVDREIRSEVTWDGTLNFNYPVEIQSTESYRIAVDTSFTIKGWMFKKADSNIGEIHTITSDFIGVSALDIDFGDYEAYKDEQDFDRFVVSGIPTINDTEPIWIHPEGGNIGVNGNLLYPDHIYISGESAMVSGMELVDLFSEEPTLSADNPPFYGKEIFTFSSVRDSLVDINIPELGTTGFLDIIILNNAGYGSIIKNAKDSSPQKDGLFVI